MALEVIGIGKPCVDLIVKVDHLPNRDESLPMEDYTMQGGGKVPTALVAAARLGCKAGFVGKVGRDTFGNFIAEDFLNHGIDVTYLAREEGKTSPFSVVLSDSQGQGRSIIWEKGTVGELKWEEVNQDYLKQAPYVHLAGSSPGEQKIARVARENGSRVVYDADFYEETVEEILSFVHVLIPSQQFAASYAQKKLVSIQDYLEVAKDLSKFGAEIVIITLGKEGAVGYYQNRGFHQPAFPVPALDTTGAGDVFHGAFIAGLLQRLAVEDCTKFASAAAALKTLALGGRAGIPTLGDIQKFLATGQAEVKDKEQRVTCYKRALHYFSPGGTVCV